LDALHAALARAERGEGTARLLFYGGSHTAGDLFTGWLRQALQARFGDAGHGFVPVVPLVEDPWAWGLRIDDAEGWEPRQVNSKFRSIARYGLVGVSFVAAEPGAFAAVASDHWGSGREASHLELLFDRHPGGGALEVWIDARLVDTIETASEAPSSGRASWDVSDGPHRFEIRAHDAREVVVYGVVLERDRPGVIVDNLGVVGGKARHQLRWDEAQWRELFTARRPDLFALAYGTNELEDLDVDIEGHEHHLRSVIARMRAAAPGASCLLIGPTDRAQVRGGQVVPMGDPEAMTEMQRLLAIEEGCAFFDTLALMGGPGGLQRWTALDPPLAREDLLHLTPAGYAVWAEALHEGLLEGYDAR
ncbi:MAG: hypothetical protein K8H88_15930, partial [Sandaracinaceae bacterium]|nr:hypothetical protein [Sandaracinaceae bacterium]